MRFSALFVCLMYLLKFGDGHALLDPYICGQPNCAPTDKFKYSTDIVYEYQYDVNIDTIFAGASENSSSLKISSMVSLEFITACEGNLKLSNITAVDQDESYMQEREESFAKELTSYQLRFAFHNGVITEICPHTDEKEWVINFKRGILSLFQNSMTRFDMDFSGNEQDIHGTCFTRYNMQGQENTSLIIKKSKDLMHCIDRFQYLSILQTVRYNFQSKFQTWPVLQSENNCNISIDHNIYTSVSCKEKHLFDPFSGKDAGAMTKLTQEIRLLNETNKLAKDIIDETNADVGKISLRYKLLHNHIPSSKMPSMDVKLAREILKEICRVEESRMSETDASERTGDEEQAAGGITVGLWGNLVRACRGLSHATLNHLFTRASGICPQGRKYVLDALPYIASIGSVQLIKNLTIQHSINEDTQQEWLNSMAMIPRPEREMIETIGDLLKWSPTNKNILLTASTMVHSYCRNSKSSLKECCQEKQNKEIIDILQNNVLNTLNESNRLKILNGESLSRNDREKVIVSIKALGNMGGFTNDFRDFLMELIEDETMSLPIRIHTVDAFRRTPCVEMRSYFLELFRKHQLDVEIRIASYLQVMRCPQYKTIHEILNILREEKINQVASFVWSHLENLEKSSIPSRVEQQGLLSSSNIPKPNMRPDIRKFSRNYEHGIFFDQYNAGGNYDANVIMSPDSYIPRSISLNMTLDMFGESINILEFKMRGEGFEKYIEKLFGPNGPLSRTNIDEKLNKLRLYRSTNQVDEIKSKIDDIDYKNEALNHRAPMMDVGLKVFGNEISYWSAEGDDEIMSAMEQLNPLYHIRNIFSGKNVTYKRASMFLDTTYSIPTGCGLPMTMNMMGTSIANLKMSGALNGMDNIMKKIKISGKINPRKMLKAKVQLDVLDSAYIMSGTVAKTVPTEVKQKKCYSMAVNIAATMSVNAGSYAGTGIRVNFRVQTTTALAATFNIDSGKLASLQISLPYSKQEIFEAKSDLIILHGNNEVKQTGTNKNKIEASTCSWSALDKAIGIKVCATYEFPNITDIKNSPYFIFAGPVSYLLSLEKADPTAKVYSFLYTWVSDNSTKALAFSFDTPGSKEKRMFNSSVNYSGGEGKAIMMFQSAENFLKAHATYKNQPENKYLECVLDIDGQKHFDAVMSLTKTEQKNGYVLVPRLHIAVNNEKITELAGTLFMTQKKGVSQCDVQLEFQTKRLASRLIGYVTWNGPSKGTKLRLDYQFLNETKETIRMDALISNRDLGQRKDLFAELGFEFTSYPKLDFYTNIKYMGNQNHIELNYNLSSSRRMEESGTLNYAFSRHRTINGYKIYHHLKIHRPFLIIDYNYEEDGANTAFSTVVTYDKVKHLGGLAGIWGKFYMPLSTKFYLNAELNATLPSFTPLVLKVHALEKANSEFDISAQGVWFTGMDASLAALYQDMSTSRLASHRLKAIITSSKFEEIAFETIYTQENKQLNINMKAEQNGNHYGLIGRYVVFSEYNFSCYGQMDMKDKSYSMNVLANLLKDINIIADIHFDDVRDIHIVYSKIDKPHIKKLVADVNWDANRDPSRKLTFQLELLNKGPVNYGGSFVFLYPGRYINGEFDILVKDWLCMWLIKFGWSPEDKILLRIKAYSDIKNKTTYGFSSELDTPFRGWKDTSLNIIWEFYDNLQSINGNITWEKEKIKFDFFTDYMFKTNEVYGEIRANINSTLPVLPTVASIARHHHIWKKTSDTLIKFEHIRNKSLNIVMFNSSWIFNNTPLIYDVSGRVALKSPVQGYTSGLLDTKFTINDKRELNSLINVKLEEKAYIIVINGHLHRITNNMLIFNVTGLKPSNVIMEGQFGFSDANRHLVALIKTPNITTGVEFLLNLGSTQDFHIYSHIALPLDFLHNFMLRAKRNSEEVDFLLGFKNVKIGFTGIWHYYSFYDFQYVYKLYTPLKGFEENGLVLKNIYNKGLDSEASIRLSEHKLGISLLIIEDGKGILQIIEEHYHGKTKIPIDKLFEDFSTDLYMVIDSIYEKDIKFNAHVNKVDGSDEKEILTFVCDLIFKNMTSFSIQDKLIIYDVMTLNNELHAKTPFKDYAEISLAFTTEIILKERYNITTKLNIKDSEGWKNNSADILYECEAEESDESTYLGVLRMKTQFPALRFLDSKFEIITEQSLMKLYTHIIMPSCDIKASGQVEVDDTFMDTSGALNMTSPYLNPYFVNVQFKKFFSDVENTIKGGLQIQNGNQNNYLFTELTWHPNSTNYLKAKMKCSFIPIVPPSDFVVSFNKEPSSMLKVLKVDARIGSKDMLYTLLTEQHKNNLNIAITSPHKGFRKVNFTSSIKDNVLTGTYQGDTVTYRINGKITGENPIEIVAILQPTINTETYTITIRTMVDKENGYQVTASMIGRAQFTLNAKLSNKEHYKEFYAILDSSNDYFEELFFKSKLEIDNEKNVLLKLQASMPFQNLKTVDTSSKIMLTSKSGAFECKYNLTNFIGNGDFKWSLFTDKLYLKLFNNYNSGGEVKLTDLSVFYIYVNPIDIGFHANLDDKWKIGGNTSVYISDMNQTMVQLNVLFPKPNLDVHTFKINFDTQDSLPKKSFDIGYTTDVSNLVSRIVGNIKTSQNDLHLTLKMENGTTTKSDVVENFLHMEKMELEKTRVQYTLMSPLHHNEATFKMNAIYDFPTNDLITLSGTMYSPESLEVFDLNLTYGGWGHSIGHLNTSTPFKDLPWLAANTNIANDDDSSHNFAEFFWPNNTAVFNFTHKYQTKQDIKIQSGIILAEIPLSTRHVITGDYSYEAAEDWSKGNTLMFYNQKQFVQGKFKSDYKRIDSRSFLDTVDIDIDNQLLPLGIHYIHQYDERGISDVKQASVYQLKNDTTVFNLTGKFDIETWKKGKQVKLMVIQGNRTVRFQNNYESLEKEMYQGSKLEWAPEVWLQYNIQIQNKTTDDEDSRQLNLNIEYPRRMFNFLALYHSNDTLLDGEAKFDWNLSGDNKTVNLKAQWDSPENDSINQHDIKVSLAHPSFRKDITFTGQYLSDSVSTSNISALLEYSEFLNEKLSFNSILEDNSKGSAREYKLSVECQHPATNLDLNLKSNVNFKYNLYQISNYYMYQKSIFNTTLRQGQLILNLNDHSILIEKTHDSDWYLINGKWLSLYPDYRLFLTVNKTLGNDTGVCVISLKDKCVVGHYNSSNDLSYHLVGQINDARSAELNAWRDFENVKTIDISSYIRLNHSKLLMSKIIWRPEMYQQIKNSASYIFKDLYGQINEMMVIVKNTPMEAHESFKNIWNDAKMRVKELLNDWNDLHGIVDDLKEFQLFLNNSYNSNEFYVKNIIEYCYNIIDELSLRDHIESLPAIINEVWQMMGNTRTTLKESITWLIETFKTSYNHFMEQISSILEGNLMDRVSDLIESGILKYDSFVKHLHMEIVSYVESLCNNMYNGMRVLWKTLLKTIEPTFIHMVHYLESYVYQFGTEALDFFYARTEELTETPFFSILSQFAQTLDSFWKDIHNEDAISNIQKYSNLFYNFVKTKIFIHIPFQKEMNEIVSEIVNELNELQELHLIKIMKTKLYEAKAKLEWWYNYFNIGEGLKRLFNIINKKAMEFPKTAIQIEESHRAPKTNFIFEPNQGLLLLEQKLPIPWHAFNRTPDFNEIPEYKVLHDLVDMWFISNTSLLSYYYEFKLYTDIYNLLPPFVGHTIMSGYGTIVTFDHKMFTVTEGGMYLLVSDFWTSNFTILMASNKQGHYDLVLLTDRDVIKINLFDQSVTIKNDELQILPLKTGDWTLQRNDEEIKIENPKGVKIKCDYLFKTCNFDFEGSYFSLVGGLFGTMNNEGFDDMMTPSRELTTSYNLIKSWKILDSNKTRFNDYTENEAICETYFQNNVSPLKACFSMFDPMQFYIECIDGIDPCMLANVYTELCFNNHIPVRIPAKCMECVSPQNKTIPEGTVMEIENFMNSTDIVFIVEAHECNQNMRKDKNMDFLINTLESKLNANGFNKNRYSIIAYGGQGIHKNAHSIYVNNKSFVSASEIKEFFDHLKIDSNNNSSYISDTFDALSKASNLNFRAGVSKTFILFPCTKCNITHYRLDYAVIHQVLTDSSVSLHIFINDEFKMVKRKNLRTLYGIDRKFAYTQKDFKKLTGDSKIRNLVKIPKSTVGFCASLALETNGTLFAVSKLKSTETGGGNRAATVFASRAALSFSSCPISRCECHAARLRCTVCPRYLSSNVIDEISLSVWESSEIEDFIDNFLDISIPLY